MALIELRLSMEVGSGNRECDTLTPANGKDFRVLQFVGESSYDPNAAVEMIWILDHATESEDPIWTIKGSGRMPSEMTKENADGTRKLGLCLDNGLAGSIYMSGWALIWVED